MGLTGGTVFFSVTDVSSICVSASKVQRHANQLVCRIHCPKHVTIVQSVRDWKCVLGFPCFFLLHAGICSSLWVPCMNNECAMYFPIICTL